MRLSSPQPNIPTALIFTGNLPSNRIPNHDIVNTFFWSAVKYERCILDPRGRRKWSGILRFFFFVFCFLRWAIFFFFCQLLEHQSEGFHSWTYPLQPDRKVLNEVYDRQVERNFGYSCILCGIENVEFKKINILELVRRKLTCLLINLMSSGHSWWFVT